MLRLEKLLVREKLCTKESLVSRGVPCIFPVCFLKMYKRFPISHFIPPVFPLSLLGKMKVSAVDFLLEALSF